MMALAVIACWSILAVDAARSWRFGTETYGIDAAIGRLEPGKRALTLVLDEMSGAAAHQHVYLHYPVWYQGEREGFVDFNFAWFLPQIVRFRPDRLPPWVPGLEWKAEQFDWQRHRGSDYDYFFVRGSTISPTSLFRGAECPPRPVWSDDHWTIFARQACH